MKRNTRDTDDLMSDLEDIGHLIGRATRKASRVGAKHLERGIRYAVNEISREFRRYQGPIVQEPIVQEPPNRDDDFSAAETEQAAPNRTCSSSQADAPKTSEIQKSEKKLPAVSTAGVLLTVFGFVGAGLLAALALFVLSVALLANEVTPPMISLILPALLAAGCAGVGIKGLSLCGRHKRLRMYYREIGTSDFYPLKQLAATTGRSLRFIVRDLERMLRAGHFSGAKFDAEKTCLILNEETYQQYLLAEETMRRKREEERRRTPSEPDSPLAAAIAEGERTLREIRQINDQIPGEEISRKISHLEIVTEKIFDCVEEHPEKLSEIRKFMNYYLPTTLKMLNTYRDFDRQPVQGENIQKSKKEISAALDTINLAFENLLDSLFEDTAFDVATDISALEAMLAQEGLTGQNAFKKTRKE